MTERLIAVANGRLVGTRLMRPSIFLIGGATICLACAGAADGPPRSGGAEWEFVEDLRLDANVEDFSQFRRFYVGPQHEIVVPEPQDFRLRLYDSTGTLVAAFGRKGEGPGEFQHVGSSFWVADTLIVWDARLSRMTYLLLGGTLVRRANARPRCTGRLASRSVSTGRFGYNCAPRIVERPCTW